MEQDGIAQLFALIPGEYAWVVPIVIGLANFVSRKIPDSATGWRSYVRRVASIVGFHGKDNKK